MNDHKDAHSSTRESVEPDPDFLASIITPTDPPKLTRIFVIITASFITLLVIYQTRICTRFVGRLFIERAALEWQVTESKRLRHEVATSTLDPNSPKPQPTIAPHHVLFGEREDSSDAKLITDTSNALLSDENVCNNFPSFDGISLNQTDAVIVPLWKLTIYGDRQLMGITEAGFVCSEDDSTLNPGALTIREKPINKECLKRLKAASIKYDTTKDGTPHMTKDGIPRIALSVGVLKHSDELKVTLLHEFMHVHAVPGFRPFLNFVHDDLTYLSEYDELLSKANLDASKNRQEYVLWLIIIIGMLMIIGNAYLAAG